MEENSINWNFSPLLFMLRHVNMQKSSNLPNSWSNRTYEHKFVNGSTSNWDFFFFKKKPVPTFLKSPQLNWHTGKIQCSLFAKGAMLFCYISVHKKPHKVKVHIATVAPEFNVTPWPKQKSAKNRAQNSVQSISSLKITQGQKCSS